MIQETGKNVQVREEMEVCNDAARVRSEAALQHPRSANPLHTCYGSSPSQDDVERQVLPGMARIRKRREGKTPTNYYI